ncbi:SusC/RagA family TonB-linked outer membrane protein [Saccharicrinis sp. GN24d3]|uniref:SusC/RagA family TonB-linked outer membrane protein n=1 Tax=Saccharicrinis sp. GN24d3 TaxID=3458416 RepID=UPI00403553E6
MKKTRDQLSPLMRKGKKWIRVMKITSLLLLFGFLQIHATVVSQGNTVSISESDISLEQLLWKIQDKSDFVFVFSQEHVKEHTNLNVNLNGELDEVLTQILADKGLTYEKKNDVYVIKKAAPVPAVPQQPNTITIKGKVTDEKGKPLPFVNIYIKGDTKGVITDKDGKYAIEVEEKQGMVLVASFIGFVSREFEVSGRTEINLMLKGDIADLDEVVVTGYQTIDREKMTGSAVAITADKMSNVGFTSIEDALDGSIAGMNIVASGRPGEDADIQIRGVNSFTGNTNPLWIVDGMPMMGSVPEVSDGNSLRAEALTSGIGNIAPEDIESITVLKDAAAAAIYGAQAANGVIVITTKSGHSGKTFFNITSNMTVTEAPDPELYMMNSAEKVDFERGYNEDYGTWASSGRAADIYRALDRESISQAEANLMLNELRNTNTDWFKEIFSSAISQQHSLSMSGGNEKTQYYVSGNFLTEEGIEPNNQYDKLGLNMKITHNPSDKIRITFGLTSNLRNTTETASIINPLQYAIYANPYEKPYNEDGSYAYDITYNGTISTAAGDDYFRQFNILQDLNENTQDSRYMSSDMNLKFEYEFLPGLTYNLQGAYNINSNNTSRYVIPGTWTDYKQSWHPAVSTEFTYDLLGGNLRESSSKGHEYTFRNTLQYMREFNGGHYVSLFGGQEIRKTLQNTFYNFFPNYDADHRLGQYPDLDGYEADILSLAALGGTGEYENKLSSFFANGTYSYNDRYVVSGSIRYDGSTIIGSDNQFTPLWNVSGRWNVHNEGFMSGSILSLLALKVGYGYTGSIDNSASPYSILYYSSGGKRYDDELTPSSLAYPSMNLKWQTKEDKNIGIEAGLWKNKVQVGFNYFDNSTEDILENKKLAASSGRTTMMANVASISNKGYEFDVTATLLSRNNFNWMVSANVSILDDEITDSYYPSIDKISASSAHAYVVGYPVNAWYGYKFHSINPDDGHVYAIGDDGEPFDLEVGQYGGSPVDLPKASYLGDLTPSYYGGVTTSVRYKQLTLRASGDFKGGHKILSFGSNDVYTNPRNKPEYLSDIWGQIGDVTNYPGLDIFTNPLDEYMFDTELEDGDYFRINMISLGYLFKTDFVNRIGMQSARINFNVRNVASFSKYKGIDPVLNGELGYPNTRKYTLSLNIGF